METQQISDYLYEEFSEEIYDTQSIIDKYGYGIKEKVQNVDYFASRGLIPLGTKHHPDTYKGHIPQSEEVNLQIPRNTTDTPMNIAMIVPSGTKKTREAKNIILGMTKLGFNIVIFQPKSNDWENAVYKGSSNFLHSTLKNTSLDIVNYAPSFLSESVKKIGVHKYKLFSLNFDNFKTPEDWDNIGAGQVAKTTIASYIKEGAKNLKELEVKLKDDTKLAPAARGSALTAISNLKRLEFFSHEPLDFENSFKKNKIILVSLFLNQGGFINVNIVKPIDELIDFSQKERGKGIEYISRKFIVFEDISTYATQNNQYVVQQITNVQNNLRSFGVNSMVIVQNPELASTAVLSIPPVKIVGAVNNPESIRPFIPPRAYHILRATEPPEKLFIDEDNYIFERLLIRGTRVQRYFPYDCMVGHF